MATALVALALFLPGAPSPEEGSSPDKRPGEAVCHSKACDKRVMAKRRQRRVQKRHKAQVRWNATRRREVAPFNAKLDRIASCESGQRWHINTGNGFYGGLQFTVGTWRSVGGSGMPHWHSELEQKYRAVKVFKRRGNWGDWPVCGYR